MRPQRFNSNSMGLAEAAGHLAALAALTWLLERVRAREALTVVDERLAGGASERAGRLAAGSVSRLCRETGRLGLETAAAGSEGDR